MKCMKHLKNSLYNIKTECVKKRFASTTICVTAQKANRAFHEGLVNVKKCGSAANMINIGCSIKTECAIKHFANLTICVPEGEQGIFYADFADVQK